MSMSKKDYVAIAAAIRAQSCDGQETYIHASDLANKLCEIFKRENSAFDRSRFLAACGVQS